MRRLMTGYAVTFNIRHRRSGHLFHNRYKSVVCEEDTYLLELTRYIHLNPLRARLVEDLKSLDKYPWSGHSVLIGKQKNPLVPEILPAVEKDKYLAEKTVEDVLWFFGKSLKEARRRYWVFVEKGIKHGRREDLQGGGLVRSAGGDKRGLLGRKKREREKGDARILGSGDFVHTTLHQSEKLLERKYRPKKTIDDLIMVVAGKVGVSPELICSRSRQRKPSEARAIFSYLAVEETGYSAADVARFLGVKRMSVHEAVTRGKALCDGYALLGQKYE
jgi:putative transposase